MGCTKSKEDLGRKSQVSPSNKEHHNNSKKQDPKSLIKQDNSFEKEIQLKKNIIEPNQKSEENELKIDLYPENVPKGELKKMALSNILPSDKLGQSLDPNKELAFPGADVPLLDGFYSAHCKHYPIRIKPDDIWLLIVQAFSNHVNANAEQLRKYFVNFEGKVDLTVFYDDIYIKENIDKNILENFSVQINEQMKQYLGKEIIQTLTSDFTTTNYDSLIISKLSIMGVFQKYFNYSMDLMICGIPYLILEGTLEDYQKIKAKAEKLSKYEFDWYIKRIIPHIQKMIDAKKGKIDNDYFRNIIKKKEVSGRVFFGCVPEEGTISFITGWILDFFAYEKKANGELIRFNRQSLEVSDFESLSSQMLKVPFTINENINNTKIVMNYIVGFIGCDQNEKKEVSFVQGWVVTPSSLIKTKMRELDDSFHPILNENPKQVEEQKGIDPFDPNCVIEDPFA